MKRSVEEVQVLGAEQDALDEGVTIGEGLAFGRDLANRAANEPDAEVRKVLVRELQPQGGPGTSATGPAAIPPDPAAAKSLAWVAFADIMVFFGVLLVGFAYLWRRGDLEWVRSTAAQAQGTATEVRNGPPHPAPASTG